jgi:hypothetical protein
MMKKVHFRYVTLAGLLATLAACDKMVDQPTVTPPPPPPPPSVAVSIVDQLGAGFATTFRASPTAEPRDPVAGDLVAVTSARDPVNF